MRKISLLPQHFSQNNQLPIRIVSPDFGHLSPEIAAKQEQTRRLPYYFFLSPKEFLTNRLILEARRRIHYGERSSVKELA